MYTWKIYIIFFGTPGMKYSLKNKDDKVTAVIEDNHRKKQEQVSNRLVRDLPTNKQTCCYLSY